MRNKKFALNKIKSKIPIKNLLGFTISGIVFLGLSSGKAFSLPQRTSSFISDSPKEVIDQVWQIVYRDYLDSSGKYTRKEWIQLRKKLLSKQHMDSIDSYEAIRGMLGILNDPYTRFLDPKEFKEMRIDTSGELMGVGIQIALDKETQEITVISPIEGTPAFKAGVKPKDVIVSIDNKSTDGMSIEDAVKLIRGRKNTSVTLGILRAGNLMKLKITRALIEIQSVDSRINTTDNGLDIGYIRLKQFNANAAKEMKNAINYLEEKGMLGYILDLRSNPGGLLESSIEIGRQWIDKGIIVITQTKAGVKDFRRANGTALTKKPVVVLVNEGSASASEIVSGAIKDNNRGILVGNKTFGKGLVQSVRSLSDGSGLIVTVAKYLTPKGTDINKNGIVPDIQSELRLDNAARITNADIGTKKDSQYIVAESALIKALSKQGQSRSEYKF